MLVLTFLLNGELYQSMLSRFLFMFVSNRWFVVLVSAFIKCLLVRTGGSVKILCGKKGMRVIC